MLGKAISTLRAEKQIRTQDFIRWTVRKPLDTVDPSQTTHVGKNGACQLVVTVSASNSLAATSTMHMVIRLPAYTAGQARYLAKAIYPLEALFRSISASRSSACNRDPAPPPAPPSPPAPLKLDLVVGLSAAATWSRAARAAVSSASALAPLPSCVYT